MINIVKVITVRRTLFLPILLRIHPFNMFNILSLSIFMHPKIIWIIFPPRKKNNIHEFIWSYTNRQCVCKAFGVFFSMFKINYRHGVGAVREEAEKKLCIWVENNKWNRWDDGARWRDEMEQIGSKVGRGGMNRTLFLFFPPISNENYAEKCTGSGTWNNNRVRDEKPSTPKQYELSAIII